MAESPSLRQPPSESEPEETAAGGRLHHRARHHLSSREIALKFAVASIAAAALSHLGPIAALGGIAVSLMVESGVERLVRRLNRKALWGSTGLLVVLGKLDRVLSAIGLRGRTGAATVATTTASAAIAGVLVFTAFTVPELAVGHSITSGRDLTFFRDKTVEGSTAASPELGSSGPAAKLTLPRASVRAKAALVPVARIHYRVATSAGRVVCTPPSGTYLPVGTTTVHCTARSGGRVTHGSFTVVVADDTAPKLVMPRSVTSQATESDGATVTYTVKASDDIDGKTGATCTPQSGSTFPVGETTVNCTAVDDGGNSANGSFTVTVVNGGNDQLALPSETTAE